MKSNFKEIKHYFETLFSLHWQTTPIHYMYQEFKGEHEKWINLIYHPSMITSKSISKDISTVTSELSVVCWAENDVDALELADDVIEFMDLRVDRNLFKMNSGEVIDQGVEGSNKVFIYILFNFTSKAGVCPKYEPTPYNCNLSIGGTSGTEFNLSGFLYPDCIMAKA